MAQEVRRRKSAAAISRIRTGIGFDVHRFASGRELVLGGVKIDHAQGLDGHSDADVLCHGVIDALLGAVADGNIGTHFPNTDPQWKGVRSLDLLESVARRLRDRSFEVVNVDTTVVAQAPMLAAHIESMRTNLARAIGMHRDRVSVKATTAERMGAIGREEGMAVMAVATVEQRMPRRIPRARKSSGEARRLRMTR